MKPDESPECEICVHRDENSVCDECCNHSRFVSIGELEKDLDNDWKILDWCDDERECEVNENRTLGY